jgi:hypothetical protein
MVGGLEVLEGEAWAALYADRWLHFVSCYESGDPMRIATCVALLSCLIALPLLADDPKPTPKTKPVGIWKRESDGKTITFTIKANDTLTLHLLDGDRNITVTAAYGITGDTLFGMVTGVEKKDEGGPEKGELFRFNFKIDKDSLELSELKATRGSDEARKLIEGTYQKNSR